MNKIKLTDRTKPTNNEHELIETDSFGVPRIITLLRVKLLNPEDIPEKLLSLKDNTGTSVLDVCIKRLQEPVIDGCSRSVPRAILLAGKSDCGFPLHFRKVKEILQIAREDGWSVAHYLAWRGKLPIKMMTEEILKLTTKDGCSVAYYAAAYQQSFPDWAKRSKEILLLGNGQGDYVAHVLAKHGKLPEESMTEEILKLKNRSKCSVVYKVVCSWHASFPERARRRKDILLLDNGRENYVAHILTGYGELSKEMMTEDILTLTNRDGCAVAYSLAKNNLLPDWAKRRKDILPLVETIKVISSLMFSQ